MKTPRVAIIEAKRTPIGKFLGAFRLLSAVDLGVSIVTGLLERAGAAAGDVDQLIFGNARQAGGGPNPARQIAYRAGIPQEVPAYTVNMACASGLKAIALACDAISAGRASCVVAGGTENMTRVPFLLDGARFGYRLGHAQLIDGMYRDGFMDPLSELLMGETAEVLAEEYGIGREEQDRYAISSQRRVEGARKDGLFAEEILPVTATDGRGSTVEVCEDEHPRSGVTMEGLAKLAPVFSKDGTVTAGNASGITDAAAALLLVSEEEVARLGKKPLGFVRDHTMVGVDPRRMGIGPVPATREILQRNDLTLDDVGLVELNEAFAVQVLACLRDLELDHERVNVRGGAISLGHPIGATGARIVVTLLHEMNRREAQTGLATLCVSGGLGMSLLIDKN
ncbi:MAG: thiolase family protein [Candidatus Krumholzibacteriia bacterium]